MDTVKENLPSLFADSPGTTSFMEKYDAFRRASRRDVENKPFLMEKPPLDYTQIEKLCNPTTKRAYPVGAAAAQGGTRFQGNEKDPQQRSRDERGK